jgi:hypothetical protein
MLGSFKETDGCNEGEEIRQTKTKNKGRVDFFFFFDGTGV